MSHLFPSAKGDQLCPLGFHPQVRWPTRCKRCFRDYKEHGNKRNGEDITASTPVLAGSSQSRSRDGGSSTSLDKPVRSWTSTHNLFLTNSNSGFSNERPPGLPQRPASWASTPDLDNILQHVKADFTVNLTLPRRRHTATFDNTEEPETTVTIKRPPLPPILKVEPKKDDSKKEMEKAEDQGVVIEKGDSLAERVRKMNLIKRQGSTERDMSREKSVPGKTDEEPVPVPKVTPKPTIKEIEPEKVERKRRSRPIPETPTEEPTSKPQLSLSKTTITSTKVIGIPSTLAPVKEKQSTKPSSSGEPSKDTTKIIRRRRVDIGTFEQPPKPKIVQAPTVPPPVPKPAPDPIFSSSSSDDVKFLFSVKDNKSKLDEDLHSVNTETTETTIVDHSDVGELKEEIESLRRELDTVKARCDRAEREKSDILLRRLASMDTVSNKTAASEALKLQQKVNEQQQVIEDLQDEKKFLSTKVKELESDGRVRGVKNVEEQLRQKLEQAETLCEELMDENEEIKRELRNMETEVEEMHDNFREDQADEYASIKKELDQTTKNCRILSFKLKKSDRKIEQLETEKAALGANPDLATKVKQLEDELKVANEVARRLQADLEQAESNPSTPTKKTPTLGKIGKSTSADNKLSRSSLTRGGSQEDPVQLLRDLQDSLEREADLREQLKYAEEEAENIRRKSSRVEDENESLMMQLKKMATKARTKSIFNTGRKLSPSPPNRRLTPDSHMEKDEGISDEDDPAELRLQLELNEQETAVLRRKIEELEIENKRSREHVKELQDNLISKTKEMDKQNKFPSLLGFKSSGTKDPLDEKKIKVMEDEISELRKKLIEKDREFERVQAEISLNKTKGGKSLAKSKSLDNPLTDQQVLDLKRQLQVVEQEAAILRQKTQTLEQDNEKNTAEIKQLQQRKTVGNEEEAKKLNTTIKELQKEKGDLESKLKRLIAESSAGMPSRTPKTPNDMHTKLQLKKMIDECENEISELRAIVGRSGAMSVSALENEKKKLIAELAESKEQRTKLDAEIKKLAAPKLSAELQAIKLNEAQRTVQKLEDENKKQNDKIKVLEEKISKITTSVKTAESNKTQLEGQLKTEKDKYATVETDLEQLRKEKTKIENKVSDLEKELLEEQKKTEAIKCSLEKEIVNLKRQSSSSDPSSEKLKQLSLKADELMSKLEDESKKYKQLASKHESLEEDHVMLKAQMETDQQKMLELIVLRNKLTQAENIEARLVKENTNLSRKLVDMQKKITSLESSVESRTASLELEKSRMKSALEEKQREYEHLSNENEMNAYQATQLRKDNDDIRSKLDDYERINKAQRTLSEHNSHLEQELKKLHVQLETAELNVKSEVAATRLRYEQQVTNLHNELTGLQRQCERFKRDRDTFKQLVEAAQKQIADMKANRRSLASVTSSSDDDDKSKIVALEQQIGCLEDELSEARLEASKVRTELISELSASEIKISEMQSKINELEEEKIIAGGKSKVPGTKTRLELSWQKERDDMQRLVQETSTLARDLRQTLFEVERERDKEKLESRRKIDQIKKTTEEEIEEGRRKVTELQSDLLELRDAHAKLRTANEKLRRDRERYERERESATRRRIEMEGDRRIGALLQTVDELVKLAPELQKAAGRQETTTTTTSTGKTISTNAPIPTPPMRHKSPSPGPGGATPQPQSVASVLGRLADASEELRRYQRMCDDEKDRERMRRGGMRRAASQENESVEGHPSRPVMRINRNGGSLYKKSLSLDQSLQIEQQGQLIWKEGDDSMSSLQSLDSEYGAMMHRDSSLDSRLSGGSTQSDMPRMRKKKRGLMGKLRSLSLTRNKGSESDFSIQGSDSDLSMAGDIRSSKTNLKGKLSGMFRRAGSSSRANSTEALDRELQRPVAIQTLGNGPSTAGGQAPVPRPVSASTPHLARSGKPPTPSMAPTQRKRVTIGSQSQLGTTNPGTFPK